jgi:HK97 family phage major capsid protein
MMTAGRLFDVVDLRGCGARAQGEHAPLVPSLRESRVVQAEGTDSLGGYTVPEQVSSSIVQRLEPASVFLAAGPRIFVMTSNVLRIPKIGSGTTAALVAENAPIPETNVTFADSVLTARKIAAIVRSSNECLEDSVPDGRQIVERDLLRELGRKLHEQFFGGNGTAPNMRGLLNQPGIDDTAVSGAITLDAVAEAVERLEANGATPNAILVGPAVWGAVPRLKDGDQRYMLAPDPSGEPARRCSAWPST